MARSKGQKRASDWVMAAIFFVVCVACLLLAEVAVVQSKRELQQEWSKPGRASNSPLTTTEVQAEFDRLRDRTDNTQKLITTLIALSSLYAIVLTVTGYLNVNKVIQDAKATLDEATVIKDRLGKEFGSLGYVSENLQRVTQELKASLPDVQQLSLLVAQLSPEDREKIYFQEKAVAFAQLVIPKEDSRNSRRLSTSLVGVARFYRGLCLLEKKEFQAAQGNGTSADAWWTYAEKDWQHRIDGLRERALFYAGQAVDRSPKHYIALNELGNCFLEAGKKDEAHVHFAKSRQCHENQQKARYHLSVYEHERGDYIAAEQYLSDALKLNQWEDKEIPQRRKDLHYNRACAYAKQSEAAGVGALMRAAMLTRACDDLSKAEVTRAPLNIKDFLKDVETGGDLVALAEDPTHGIWVREIKARAQAAWVQ